MDNLHRPPRPHTRYWTHRTLSPPAPSRTTTLAGRLVTNCGPAPTPRPVWPPPPNAPTCRDNSATKTGTKTGTVRHANAHNREHPQRHHRAGPPPCSPCSPLFTGPQPALVLTSPQDLTTTQYPESGTIALTWSPPHNNGGAAITSILIHTAAEPSDAWHEHKRGHLQRDNRLDHKHTHYYRQNHPTLGDNLDIRQTRIPTPTTVHH